MTSPRCRADPTSGENNSRQIVKLSQWNIDVKIHENILLNQTRKCTKWPNGEEKQLTLDPVGLVGGMLGKTVDWMDDILVAKISITGTEKKLLKTSRKLYNREKVLRAISPSPKQVGLVEMFRVQIQTASKHMENTP